MKKTLTIFILVLFSSITFAKDKPKHQLKWVLAHEPVALFQKAAKTFAKIVDERTNGEVEVTVYTPAQYYKKYKKVLTPSMVVDLLQSGEIQMSQTYTTHLGRYHDQLWVLDLPFLFKTHEHATKVLEGEVGNELLAGLQKNNIKGLAFTYSGGYRVIPTTHKELRTIEDFKNLKIRTSPSPVAQEVFRALGAKPIPMSLRRARDAAKSGKIAGAETTYPRYYTLDHQKYAPIMNETKHSLFLTSIVMNDKYFQKISAKNKKIIKQAAIEAARIERQDSIDDGEVTKKRCLKDNIKIISMSDKEVTRFKKVMEPVEAKFQKMFKNDIVNRIKNIN